MRRAIKGALLSALIFPGVGQLSLGQTGRGWAFLLAALACVGVLVNEIVSQINASLANLDLTQVSDPSALASQLEQSSSASSAYTLSLLLLAVCWLWSLVDAYLTGLRLDRQG